MKRVIIASTKVKGDTTDLYVGLNDIDLEDCTKVQFGKFKSDFISSVCQGVKANYPNLDDNSIKDTAIYLVDKYLDRFNGHSVATYLRDDMYLLVVDEGEQIFRVRTNNPGVGKVKQFGFPKEALTIQLVELIPRDKETPRFKEPNPTPGRRFGESREDWAARRRREGKHL